jgi:hypothetical protein
VVHRVTDAGASLAHLPPHIHLQVRNRKRLRSSGRRNDWTLNRIPVPKSATTTAICEHRARDEDPRARDEDPRKAANLQEFRGCERDSGPRLKSWCPRFESGSRHRRIPHDCRIFHFSEWSSCIRVWALDWALTRRWPSTEAVRSRRSSAGFARLLEAKTTRVPGVVSPVRHRAGRR